MYKLTYTFITPYPYTQYIFKHQIKGEIMLEKRKEYLENIINKLSKSKLKDKYANQKIHVSTSNGRQQFYLINSKTKARTYLSKEQQEYIHELIQRDYESEVLKSATDELKAINKYPDIRVESIFENIHEAKKKYITPIINNETLYINNWLSAPSISKLSFPDDLPIIKTASNLQVRSKSELIIADTLDFYDIPYKYEFAHVIKGKTLFPDFTILDIYNHREIIWEHLGLMDDYQYLCRSLSKLELYEEDGFFIGDNLILTWETNKIPFTSKKAANTIKHYILDKYK